jgi:group I intron endonuclease
MGLLSRDRKILIDRVYRWIGGTMNQGVYVITHIKSDKKYVGSSVTLKRRLNRHRNELRKGIHRNQPLQRAWAKYGEEAFVFEVLERVQDDSTLLCREQHWMDTLRKTHKLYNTCPKAGSPLGMKLTPEQRAKISSAHKGKKKSAEHCAAMAEGAKTRVRTPEEIDHWKNMWTGKVKSPEHLAKIGASIKATWARKRAEREAKAST